MSHRRRVSAPYINDGSIGKVAQEASEWYEAGASGIVVWDPQHLTGTAAGISTNRFGHREELPAVIARGAAGSAYLKVIRVGGTIMNGRFPPYWGG